MRELCHDDSEQGPKFIKTMSIIGSDEEVASREESGSPEHALLVDRLAAITEFQ